MTQLNKTSSKTREDNSLSLADCKGANSGASSSPCSGGRTEYGTAREKRSAAAARTTSTLPGPVAHGRCTRKVVYYQNRFIVIDSAPAAAAATAPTSSSALHVTSCVHHGGGGGAKGSAGSGSRKPGAGAAARDRLKKETGDVAALYQQRETASSDQATRCTVKAATGISAAAAAAAAASDSAGRLEGSGGVVVVPSSKHNNMDAPPATVDGRGIEIIVSDETGISHRPDKPSRLLSGKRAAALKRVGTVLLDNRMKGKENCQHLLMEHPEEYRVLKKVLNIIFVTVGMALLVSVFVVIIYTAVVGDADKSPSSSNKVDTPSLPSNNTQSSDTTTPIRKES